jgi:hypothetical protein
VDQVCEDVTSRARVNEEQPAGEEDDDGGQPPRFHSGERSKSMVADREEKQGKRNALQKAALEASMLGRFIRLADYMLVENLLVCIEGTLIQFKEELANQPLHKDGIFATSIFFSEEAPHDLAFKPDEETVQMLIRTMEEVSLFNTLF